MVRRLAAALAVALVAATPAAARDDARSVRDAVELGVPRSVTVTWTGISVEVPVRVRPVGVAGRVERLRFVAMQLNGIPFEVEPYAHAFEIPEKEAVTLPEPLRLRAEFKRIAPGLLEEALLPNEQLRLTGRIVVDGTFKKWIFSLKREVEVPVDVTGENPMADYHPLKLAIEQYRRWERSGFRLPL